MCEAEIWNFIELSESYLVSSMYEEAASLSSSVIKRVWKETVDHSQLHDILESAGMVFVQSLEGLGRTEEISNELKLVFGKIATLPVQVLLTGVCFQISNRTCSGVQELLEEYLSKWMYVDEGYITVNDSELDTCVLKEYLRGSCLEVDAYMSVVELYAVTYIGEVIKDVDRALSWSEKATLPEDRRQGLLRKLHSLLSLKATNVSKDLPMPQPDTFQMKDPLTSQGSSEVLDKNYPISMEESNQAIVKSSTTQNRFRLWMSTTNMKFCENILVIPKGKIMLMLLVFLFCYAFRKKRADLTRAIKSQLDSTKKAFADLWQLAFSYQVNPLAAVQPLSGP